MDLMGYPVNLKRAWVQFYMELPHVPEDEELVFEEEPIIPQPTSVVRRGSLLQRSSTRKPTSAFGLSSMASMAASIDALKPKPPIILSQTQRKEIEEMFQLFDTDGSGTMEMEEIKVLLWALGFQPDEGEVEQMLSDFLNVDVEEAEQRSLDLPEFLRLMSEKILNAKDLSEMLTMSFELFDTDHKGYIVLKDLKKVAREINATVTEQEFEMMMAHIDKSGDGEVTLDEWIRVMANSI